MSYPVSPCVVCQGLPIFVPSCS